MVETDVHDLLTDEEIQEIGENYYQSEMENKYGDINDDYPGDVDDIGD